MSPLRSIVSRERVALVGDALLATATAFAVVMGLTALVAAPTGDPRAGMEWATVLGSLLSMAAVVVVPVLVWVRHGRRLSWLAVLGGALGAASTGVVFMALAALSGLLGLVASPITDSEFAGPLAMLVIVSAAVLALITWLVVDAVRDLAPRARRHVGWDVMRLACAAVLAAFAVGVGVYVAANPGDESGEALIYAMLAGLAGALAVGGAELFTSLAPRKEAPPPVPAVPDGGPVGMPS